MKLILRFQFLTHNSHYRVAQLSLHSCSTGRVLYYEHHHDQFKEKYYKIGHKKIQIFFQIHIINIKDALLSPTQKYTLLVNKTVLQGKVLVSVSAMLVIYLTKRKKGRKKHQLLKCLRPEALTKHAASLQKQFLLSEM